MVASVVNGYQHTSYRFRLEAEKDTTKDGKVWIAIAFPWAPHKPNGGFKIISNNFLTLLEENSDNIEDITQLCEDDIQIWIRLRSLKSEKDIELVHVQEMIQWYLDDIGVLTFWATPQHTYQINYSHKIASDSCLFLPTRLPIIIASAHKPKMDYKVWVVDGVTVELPKYLERVECLKLENLLKESQKTLDCFTFTDWDWDEDTRIHTENWESSDDEDFEDSEES